MRDSQNAQMCKGYTYVFKFSKVYFIWDSQQLGYHFEYLGSTNHKIFLLFCQYTRRSISKFWFDPKII